MDGVNVTLGLAQLLRVFVDDLDAERHGYELMSQTGFKSGKLYPMLAKLTRAGWLERTDPGPQAAKSGGPPRVTYRLAPAAVPTVLAELQTIDRSIRLPKLSTSKIRRRSPAEGT